MSAGFFTRARPSQQLWTANREQLLRAQAHGLEARPVAVAVTDGEIDVLAREVDVMQRRRNPQVDLGVRLGEAAEPVHEPLGGEIRRRADRQHAGPLALQQALGAERDPVERVAHARRGTRGPPR